MSVTRCFMKEKPVHKSLIFSASPILYVTAPSSENPTVFREMDQTEDEVITSRFIGDRQAQESDRHRSQPNEKVSVHLFIGGHYWKGSYCPALIYSLHQQISSRHFQSSRASAAIWIHGFAAIVSHLSLLRFGPSDRSKFIVLSSVVWSQW